MRHPLKILFDDAGKMCGPAHLLMALAGSLGAVAGAFQPMAMRVEHFVDCELCAKETCRREKVQVGHYAALRPLHSHVPAKNGQA